MTAKPNQFVPTYSHIKNDIINKIESGVFKPGDPLPGRWKLVEEFNTSWGTLNRAMSELIIEGVLYAEKGKGTFVTHFPKLNGIKKIKALICNPKRSVYFSLMKMMEGIREAAHNFQYTIEYSDVPASFAFTEIDQSIIITPTLTDLPYLRQAWNEGQRFVVLGSDFPGEPFPCINADTRNGTFQGVQSLIKQGHTKIGLFGVQYNFPNYHREIEGYRDAMFANELPILSNLIVSREDDQTATNKLFLNWISSNTDCTALLVADYTSTISVLNGIKTMGQTIPEFLSIVAMDEIPTGDFLETPLTTIIQPFSEMGKKAVFHIIQKPEQFSIELLPCEIKERASIKPITASKRD